ncbi:2-amino-4-hydroxy-6-hydroxymethyldihydropteridine pyrophosphokinase [Enhygromyxa salina]|uniref:2-amino-4-hydroxy-6-hydroxymethyldihydropteridine pyrophosphokinase n=2 Tax=Enhygromyxa salina TaxID=215803 RepID=A0A0C2CT21_9BACT|nr:2-amino-4-hydroxy-6-hydroxymethyldihydropteridine pyrophosphokinase [Enhygromyxa salina]
MARYFVGLGSNLGDRLATLRAAATELAALAQVTLAAHSSVWETRPLGPGADAFLNAAVELHTALPAADLLAHMLGIERGHGRVRRERWGDRTLDLDLLCGFGPNGRELSIAAPNLTLPHPELSRRDFVLQPLLDMDPLLRVHGRRCAELLAALEPSQRTLLRRLPAPLVELTRP